MPNHMTVAQINAALSTESVRAIRADAPELVEQVSRSGAFVDVARALLDLSDDALAYLEAIPTALQEAVRAAVADAVNAGKAVQFQYSPAYDFEVRLWDFGEAISVHVSGPYPTDVPRERYLGSRAE